MTKQEKQELKKVIIEELKRLISLYKCNEKFIEVTGNEIKEMYLAQNKKLPEIIADNILARIPESESVLTEDRIIEVLSNCAIDVHNRWVKASEDCKKDWHDEYGKKVWKDYADDIREIEKKYVSEILQDQGWESIGTVKIMEENIDNVGYWFKEWIDKDIEIAVRVIKNKQ